MRTNVIIRILVRNLVRIVAFAALFSYALPFLYSLDGRSENFSFNGSPLAALGVGVAYMALMCLAVLFWDAAPRLPDVRRRKLLLYAVGATVIGTALILQAIDMNLLGLTVIGWEPALTAGVISAAVMHFTSRL